MISANVSVKSKTLRECEEDLQNPSKCACKCDKDRDMDEYLKGYTYMESIVHDLVVTCDKIEDTSKSASIIPSNGINYLLNAVILLAIACSEADSGLVKLVVMTNIFFKNQQHEIKIKLFICVKQIKSSFFSNN